MPPTHEVFNQPPPLAGYDVADDPAMLAALQREGAGWAQEPVRALGRQAGSAQAAEWGLAIEAPDPKDLDERTESLVERIAAVPVNQLIMVKLALNSALLQQGVLTSRMVSTVFDGVARHTPEGHAFVADAVEHGFRDAVRHRDEPFGDHGRRTSQV